MENWGNAKKHNEQILEHNRLKPTGKATEEKNKLIKAYVHDSTAPLEVQAQRLCLLTQELTTSGNAFELKLANTEKELDDSI